MYAIRSYYELPISMGTCALLGAAFKTLEYFGKQAELTFITAGDVGEGDGSLKIYDELHELNDDLTIIHYIKPKISEIIKVDFSKKVIGDAGGMYVITSYSIHYTKLYDCKGK